LSSQDYLLQKMTLIVKSGLAEYNVKAIIAYQ
jgi:hypothetical protein